MMRQPKRSMVGGRWSKKTAVFVPSTINHQPSTRLGTTLSEVLVSTLVMSIGVVALATLFPISVLRSIQASQLTNAAVLRYNAESQLRTVPEIMNIGTEWEPGKAYQPGDMVVPPLVTRRKTPPSVFLAENAGTSGGSEPQWDFRELYSFSDGVPSPPPPAVTWRTIRLKNYVIDPLGFLLVDPTDPYSGPAYGFRGTTLTGTRQHFGNVGGNPFSQYINRFPAFGHFQPNPTNNPVIDVQNEVKAALLSILPDSWTFQAESLDVAYTAGNLNIVLGGVNGAELMDSVQYSTPDLVPDRIVIFDDTLRRSYTFPVTSVTSVANGAQVGWSGIALPAGFTPAKARVESLERRYSYLLSVRRGNSGATYVDVVVFFRRSYSVTDEQVYSCVFREIDRGPDGQPGVAGTNDNRPPTGPPGPTDEPAELGWKDTDDEPRNFCIVQYSSTGNKPFYKKGSYVCDVNNLRWYRVIDVAEDVLPPFNINDVAPSDTERSFSGNIDPVATGMDRFVRLTLDQPILQDSPMDVTNGNPFDPVVTNGVVGGAVLMKGIVEVFPLRLRVPWEE